MANKSTLETNLRGLINGYKEAQALLKKQITAVVDNDLEQITNLAEDQITQNSRLEIQEKHLRACLNTIAIDNNLGDASVGLGAIVETVYGNDETLGTLRNELIENITGAQRAQHQLNGLLSFARDHIETTLRSIYQIGSKSSMRYNNKGSKQVQESSLINRYA